MNQQTAAKPTALAVLKKDVVDKIAGRVGEMVESRELSLPPDYSVGNAMKAAWLALQEVKTKDGALALKHCTPNSVANALLDMAVQGLSPAKKQCYFVAYGKTLVLIPSRFGRQALMKRVLGPQADLREEVVYEGDEFEYTIDQGRKVITRHIQKLENIDIRKIRAAYSVLDPGDGSPLRVEVMTFAQIQKAWQQGQTKGNSPAHQNFTDEMCKKTVTNRLLKQVIYSSDDAALVAAVDRQQVVVAQAEVDMAAEEEANATVVDFDKRPRGVAQEEVVVEDENVISPEEAEAMDALLDGDAAGEEVYDPDGEAEAEEQGEDEEEVADEEEGSQETPAAQFSSMISSLKLDATKARKLAAHMVRLDDVRKLTNEDLLYAVSLGDTFREEYEKVYGPPEAGPAQGELV